RNSSRQKQKPKPYSLEEITLLLDAFDRDYPQLLPFIQFLLGTGCRIGEATGLRWGDLSADCKMASIRFQFVNGRLKTTKCDSDRDFFLPASLVTILGTLNRGEPDEFVFRINGHPIDRHSFLKRIWKPLLLREGILYRKPSAFRHNFCSWLLHNGVSVVDAAKITGHDPKVLLDSYASSMSDSSSIPDFFKG
ncbi:MAG: tyrosine-type recombinase/integrase, partial [Microcoleaceae cyanobacterium]